MHASLDGYGFEKMVARRRLEKEKETRKADDINYDSSAEDLDMLN